jgi:hypothetical protein
MNGRTRHRQRSQAMTEFALVAPVLLLFSFGIIDFGRALYFYTAAGSAAREGARAAAAAQGTSALPTSAQVQSIAQVHFPGAVLQAPTCPNGPIPSTVPPGGDFWVFTTESGVAAGGAIESSPAANAAGGDAPAASGACSAVNPAIGRQELQVTVIYNFVPVTPLVSSVIGNHVVFTLQVLARTEY